MSNSILVAVVASLTIGGVVDGATPADRSASRSTPIAQLKVQAESGDTNALFRLGVAHQHGRGVAEDDA